MIFYIIFSIYLLLWALQLGFCFGFKCLRKNRKSAEVNKLKTTVDSNNSNFKKSIFTFINGIEKWTIRRVGKIPSHLVRNFCYKYVFGLQIDKDVVIYSESIFRSPSKISIGRGTVIGDRCELDGRGNLIIGEDCNLSSEVHIWTAQHDPQGNEFDYISKPVVIGDKCWISSNTIILPGVTVGDGVVLAAGAVLVKDAEPYSIYAGVPAKKITDRNHDLKYHFNGSHDWFV